MFNIYLLIDWTPIAWKPLERLLVTVAITVIRIAVKSMAWSGRWV